MGVPKGSSSTPSAGIATIAPAAIYDPSPTRIVPGMVPDFPAVGRNDPCPCGSGRRYKQCHGAVGNAAATPETLTRQGMAAHQGGNLDAAEALYRQALAAAPDLAPALHYLGVVLYQRNRLDEALPLLDRAVALVPQEPEFHNNRGLALAAAQRDHEAMAAYRAALERKPDHAGAWNNLGLALQVTGDVDGALAAFRRGLSIAPQFAPLHWNLALALLLRGHYAEGWREYEWRERAPEFAAFLHRHPAPRWTGARLDGGTILLTVEQGLGDAIQMLRFAQCVAQRGARVVAAVPPALRNLAATAPGVAAAFGPDDPLPQVDAQASLMSLPGLFTPTLADAAVDVPYLTPDPARLRTARLQVAAAAGGNLRVGIAWSGAPGNTLNARRSLPLAQCAPLFAIEGVTWFSLKRAGEVFVPDDAAGTARLVELDLRNDFDDLAALVASLDLVISVDTSLAHLAGALGKPLWVLLARTPDWRWLLDRDDSPWYPTARLFRQRTAGDWAPPVAAIAEALRAQLAGRQA
jgi:Flp pilus assembly protein TadD